MNKLLIIEDYDYIADMYKIKFDQEGYEVFMAADGIKGIEIAQKEKPDLILLDLVMPKVDGYQVLQALKGNPETRNIKVYILSNLVQDTEVNKAFALDADGYLVKASLTPSQLADNVKRILAGEKVGLQKKNKNHEVPSETQIAVKNVLLVEDEEAIANMYKLQLEAEKYKVDIANNGAWGIKLAKEKKYDIILLDMVMPAMNGYEALKQIKTDGLSKEAPVIILSNSGQDRDVRQAKNMGANAYLIKSSITPITLVKEIKKII